MWKKSIGSAALRIIQMNSRSCHSGMPTPGEATTVRRPMKNEVDIRSKARPRRRQLPRARGMCGVSMKP